MVFPSEQKLETTITSTKTPTILRHIGLESTHRAHLTFLVENVPKILNKWLTLHNVQPVEVEVHANINILYDHL